tara:strand:- start:168 stop:314 length:147 start_codon:yes stop_codon:yes gene_type:complete
MIKKIIFLIIIGAIGYYVYNNHIKTDFDKAEEAIEETANNLEDAVENM